MRTNELHASAKTVKRSSGRSSVSAAAYRAGEKLLDERTGLIHDYRSKKGIEHTRIYAPDGSPEWVNDRSQLWNRAEKKENRRNSVTAREWEIAFPHEFNIMQRREAGNAFCQELVQRLNCVVDIAYHEPNRNGDERNFHAHILFTTRGIDTKQADGWEKSKYRHMNSDKVKVAGKNSTLLKEETRHMRAFAAEEMNRIAARDKLQIKTEYLSFEARGIDREPSQKMGQAATEIERKGYQSERGDINRTIKASNDNVIKLKAQENIISLQHIQEIRALEKQIEQEKLQERKAHQLEKIFKEKASLEKNADEKQASQNLTEQQQPPEVNASPKPQKKYARYDRKAEKEKRYRANAEARERGRKRALQQKPVQAIQPDKVKKIEPVSKRSSGMVNQHQEQAQLNYEKLQKRQLILEASLKTKNPFKQLRNKITGRSKTEKNELNRITKRIAAHDKQLKEQARNNVKASEQLREKYLKPAEQPDKKLPQNKETLDQIFDKYRKGELEVKTQEVNKEKDRSRDDDRGLER